MKYSVEKKCQCEIAAACGMNFTEIGRGLGVNKSTVRFWLKPATYEQSKKRQKERYYENQEKEIERSRRWKEENPEKVKQASRAWREANPERVREGAAAWAAKNREKIRQFNKDYYWRDPEKARAVARGFYAANREKKIESARKRYAENRDTYIENARRRSQKMASIPTSPIEKLMIRNYYIMARELTEQTGIKHEVDHIWPIAKGGPHLPWNLQVLTAEENRKKRDKI